MVEVTDEDALTPAAELPVELVEEAQAAVMGAVRDLLMRRRGRLGILAAIAAMATATAGLIEGTGEGDRVAAWFDDLLTEERAQMALLVREGAG